MPHQQIHYERTKTATNTKVTVGSSSTPVLTASSDRIAYAVVNDSDEVIYLSESSTAVINEGIRLNANGGSRVSDRYNGDLSAICASGGKNLTVNVK